MLLRLLAIVLLFSTWSCSPSRAQIINTLPFQLQNGTTADATQVMADFNQIVANTNANGAKNGVNSDITSLIGLTTPLAHLYGGTNVYSGATSTGTNTVAVASTVPATFVLAQNAIITFVVGNTNVTGSITTLAVNGGVATNVYRRTTRGVVATAGGELVAGNVATLMYDGTQWQILGQIDNVGQIEDNAATTAAPGRLLADGSCQLRTDFATLFALIGTTYDPTGSTCDVNHFALPDLRGRMTAGYDNMGGTAASRINLAGSGCAGTTLGGAGCGGQVTAISQVNVPSYTITLNPFNIGLHGNQSPFQGGGAGPPNNYFGIGAGFNGNTGQASWGVTDTVTPTANSGGSGTPLSVLNPLQIVSKAIKF